MRLFDTIRALVNLAKDVVTRKVTIKQVYVDLTDTKGE